MAIESGQSNYGDNPREYAAELERLNQNLKKFQLAVENTSDHIIITDPEGIVIYANKAVERITGYQNHEVLNKKAGTLWGKQMSLEFYQNLWRTIKHEKKDFVGEAINKRKSGELYHAHVTISPILDEDNNVMFFVGIERDITKEKETNKAKSEFVSLVSHQMRTPLASISLAAEMLISGFIVKALPKQKKYLKIIYKEIREMANLIELFLNVSRIELGTLFINPEKPTLESLRKKYWTK